MATAVETFKNFFNALKDYSQADNFSVRAELDHAIRAVSPVLDWDEAVSNFQNAIINGMAFSENGEIDTSTTLQNLQQLTGIVLGDNYDLNADTGAISGKNAGGSVVKDAQSIVPEDGDLSTATLPEEGSTTQITYTGDDGKSFTFNVKWPESFTKFVSGTAVDTNTNIINRMRDSRFLIDINDFDSNEVFEEGITYGQMKNAAPIILKGLNTYWLKESAKLIYDSYGLDFDGKTIEIQFMSGGNYGDTSGITVARNTDDLPADNIIIGLNLLAYCSIDPTNPNGAARNTTTGEINPDILYLDRVVAHEMVHAAMMATGTLKAIRMPSFFGEGIADLVEGDEDYNSRQTGAIRYLATNSDTLVQTLSVTTDNGLAYPAGHMFFRYIAKQASDATIFVGTEETKNQTIDFNGGDGIITNYDESNTINYNADFLTARLMDLRFNDFLVLSNNDNGLLIRDARGKLITFSMNGNNAYAYMAENAGELDGRNFNGGDNYEIIFGANSKNNILRAGNGGSVMWGGYLGNDELFGGSGVDQFIYDINGGDDTFHDVESQDTVLLRNMTLDQITSAEFTDNGIKASFSYGGTLNIEGQPTNFILEKDNVTYKADYQNKTWIQNN